MVRIMFVHTRNHVDGCKNIVLEEEYFCGKMVVRTTEIKLRLPLNEEEKMLSF